jgi:LAS superfamily LD-carboxypeptidase LdcB
MKLSHDHTLYLAGVVAIIGIIASVYLFVQGGNKNEDIESLLQDRNALLQEMNNKTAELAQSSSTILELQEDFDDLKEDLEDLADDYRDEKDKNDDFEGQIRGLAGTLGDLDKLAKIDEELLAKYSKVYFLNENFIPERLKQIDDKYVQEGKGDEYFHASAINHLEDMFKDALRDDIDLQIISAYRSFDEQTDLKGQFTQVYGEGANTFSADQGYSEHQLGTTLDITTPSVGGTYSSFAETEAFEWLQKNAYKHGFILSYPEGNEFYVYEPWHWRFVGSDLAKHLYRSNSETFYTMEQRDINKYLLELFD